MEIIGGIFILWLVGCAVFSLFMRARGKGEEVDKAATNMVVWWMRMLK